VHFQTVLDQDEKHNLNEILREIGAVIRSAHANTRMPQGAGGICRARPYDPKDSYYYTADASND